MKILLSTFSCAPVETSEPGNAWRTIQHALSRNHEVWAVIDACRYKTAMVEHLEEHPLPGFHPVFIELSPGMTKLFRRSSMIGGVYYHAWQQKLVRVAKELQAKIGFDLAHHVTFGRYWSPSGVRALGIPFIWGPVGAAEYAPRPFVSELPLREQAFEAVRDGIRAVATLDPALRATARATTIGVGVTRESCEALRRLGVRRVEQLNQAALTDSELAAFGKFPAPPEGPFRAICMGRHLHWKGFHLAIRAFARFAKNDPEAELWLVNNGPFRAYLEKTAAESGAGSRVKFWGHLPRFSDVLDKLEGAHVLMHPALHEAFGNVCMEAMAAGRPVVCLDIGGPASQVTPECGFIAPATNPEEAIEAMAGFLTKVSKDRALLLRMSDAARKRVRDQFSMTKMGAAYDRFYAEAVGEKN